MNSIKKSLKISREDGCHTVREALAGALVGALVYALARVHAEAMVGVFVALHVLARVRSKPPWTMPPWTMAFVIFNRWFLNWGPDKTKLHSYYKMI